MRIDSLAQVAEPYVCIDLIGKVIEGDYLVVGRSVVSICAAEVGQQTLSPRSDVL